MPEQPQRPSFDPVLLSKVVLGVLEQMDAAIPQGVVLDPVQCELYDLLNGIEDDLYRVIGMAEYRRTSGEAPFVPVFPEDELL